MNNPWEEISLDDYENHMSLDSVKQLQAMNSIMKNQFDSYPVETVEIFGVAGGNGLEHIQKDRFRAVYGIFNFERINEMINILFVCWGSIGYLFSNPCK